MKYFLALLLFPLKILSQDVTGVWTGTIYNDSTKRYIPYEIVISENRGKLSGFSHTVFMENGYENIGVKEIRIKKKEDKIYIEDEQLIYNNYNEPPPKGVRSYNILGLSSSGLVLSGSFYTTRTRDYLPLTGTVRLTKKDNFDNTRIIPKLTELKLVSELSFFDRIGEKNTPVILAANKKESIPEIEKTNAITQQQNKIPVSENDSGQKTAATEEVINLTRITAHIDNIRAPRLLLYNPTVKKMPPLLISKEAKEFAQTLAVIQKQKETIKKTEQANALKEVKKPESIPQNKLQDKPVQKVTTQITKQTEVIVKNSPPETVQTVIKNKIPETSVPPMDLSGRKIETIKSIWFKSDSLVLSLYDNGEIDGDTVSIILNGINIMPRQGLGYKPIIKTIYISPDMGDSLQLVMYAENLGSIPPNTGLLILQDGEDRYEIRFAGDLQKNSAINLRRKPKN